MLTTTTTTTKNTAGAQEEQAKATATLTRAELTATCSVAHQQNEHRRGFAAGRLGLFIHFGLYSLLGGEWQGRSTPWYSEWLRHSLQIDRAEYAALAASFDPAEFSAAEIARWARASGFHYLCFTAKHHDGFALFDSKVDSFNSWQRCPQPRDFVRELQVACAEEGLGFCLYYSQAQDWDCPGGLWAYAERATAAEFAQYFAQKCLPQLRELLQNYGPLEMLWLDTPMSMSQEQAATIRQLVKELQPKCLINGRLGHGLGDFATMQDNYLPALPLAKPWEVPLSLNESWGYKKSAQAWLSAAELCELYLKVISRGGRLLLNVGPDGLGRIPKQAQALIAALATLVQHLGDLAVATLAPPPYVYETPGIYFWTKPYRLIICVLAQAQVGSSLHLEQLLTPVEACYLHLAGHKAPLPLCFEAKLNLEGEAHLRLDLPTNYKELRQGGAALVLELVLSEEGVSYASL